MEPELRIGHRPAEPEGQERTTTMQDTTRTQEIVYKRKRGARYYLEVDGTPVRVTAKGLITVEFNYGKRTLRAGYGPTFTTDYMGKIYCDSDREWSDQAETWFYPWATREEADLFNRLIDTIKEHCPDA